MLPPRTQLDSGEAGKSENHPGTEQGAATQSREWPSTARVRKVWSVSSQECLGSGVGVGVPLWPLGTGSQREREFAHGRGEEAQG